MTLSHGTRSEIDWPVLISLFPFFIALWGEEGIFSRLCFKLVL
ncbi:MAG: hypothetical protein VX051_02155 [Verrucomicrobiota bacterium]|nr:hypothetical protein [Verrucomicrobiota bacterium]